MAFPGASYHVMARGNSKALIFLDRVDSERFLELLDLTLLRSGARCLAFCLMPNHYHLVLVTPDANLSEAMRYLNSVYSQWWNQRHGRCGHVLQGRFKAQLVQRERYLLAVCRYVVLNPVRAGLVPRPEDWPWSSYCASARMAASATFLDRASVDSLLAGGAGSSPGDQYRRFVAEAPGEIDVGPSIRRDDRFIGDESFLSEERQVAARCALPGVPRREPRRPAPELSRLFESAKTRQQRDERIGDAIRRYGYPVVAIAAHLRLHPATVGTVLRKLRRRGNAPQGARADGDGAAEEAGQSTSSAPRLMFGIE